MLALLFISTLFAFSDAKRYIKHIPTGLCVDVVNWTQSGIPYLNTCGAQNKNQHFRDDRWATGLERSDKCLFANTGDPMRSGTELKYDSVGFCQNTGAHYQAHWSVDNANDHLYLWNNGKAWCMDAGADGPPRVGARVWLYECINGEYNQRFRVDTCADTNYWRQRYDACRDACSAKADNKGEEAICFTTQCLPLAG
ncbi:hypothetical protein HDV05_005056, partial [Chytridiales sp. JEL 0842]